MKVKGAGMAKVVFVKPESDEVVVDAADGENAMRAATSNLVPGIVGECGGDLSCATCHVFVDPEWYNRLPAPSDDETEMLEATSEEPTEYSRLCCQIVCGPDTDGIVLHIPDSQQ